MIVCAAFAAGLGALIVGCATSRGGGAREPSGTAAHSVVDPRFEPAVDEVSRMLAPRILILDRPVITFHYEADDFNLRTPADVAKHVGDWTERFYDPTAQGGGEAGPGVYVAVDAEMSRSYGGLTPKLFVVPIRAGVRVLNLDVETRESETRTGYDIMKEYGCPPMYESDGFYNFLSQMRQTKNPFCRDVMIESVRRLGTQAISYGYRAEKYLRGCRDYRPVAINIIARDAIDTDQIGYFTDDVKIAADPKLAAHVGRLFRDLRADPLDGAVRMPGDTHSPKTLTFRRGRSREFAAWKAENIAYCGPQWSLESDTIPYADFLKKVRLTYLDPALRRVENDLVNLMIGDQFYVPLGRINGIETLMARRLKLRPGTAAFRAWQKAKDSLDAEGGQSFDVIRIKRAAQILNEPRVTVGNGFDTLFISLPASDLARINAGPEMAMDVPRALGFGPVLSEMIGQEFLRERHLPMLLAPVGSSADEQKMAYKTFLMHCLAVWRDPSRSLAVKTDGECGVRPIDKTMNQPSQPTSF